METVSKAKTNWQILLNIIYAKQQFNVEGKIDVYIPFFILSDK